VKRRFFVSLYTVEADTAEPYPFAVLATEVRMAVLPPDTPAVEPETPLSPAAVVGLAIY
jgi:hypothetical protein